MVPQTGVFTGGDERHRQQRHLWTTAGSPPTTVSSQGQPHCGSSTSSVNPWATSLSRCLQAEFQRQQKKNLACSEHWGDRVWLRGSCFHRIPGFMCHGGDFSDYHGTGGVQLQEKYDENFTLKHGWHLVWGKCCT